MDRSKAFAWAIVLPTAGLMAALIMNRTSTPPLGAFLFWVALLAATELLPVSLGLNVSVSMAFPIHLALVIIYSDQVWVAMTIAVLGVIYVQELRGQDPLYKALFNRATSALSVGAAGVPLWLWQSGGSIRAVPVVVAAVLYLVVNLGLVGGALHLEREIPLTRAFRIMIPDPAAGFLASYVLLAGLGVATALAYTSIENGGWAVAAILIPLLFARISIIGARTQHELSEKLRLQQEALLTATEKVFSEREQQRRQIAESIHDSSLQLLAAASFACGNAHDLLAAGHEEKARTTLASARTAIDEAMTQLRGSLVDLRRSSIEKGGLVESIEKFAGEVSTLWGTQVRIVGHIQNEPPIPVALAAFQILQESLTNALKHGASDEVVVHIEERENKVHIVVEDRGVGFDALAPVDEDHVGMRLMRERAASVGGKVELHTEPGAGTKVEAVLPAGVAR